MKHAALKGLETSYYSGDLPSSDPQVNPDPGLDLDPELAASQQGHEPVVDQPASRSVPEFELLCACAAVEVNVARAAQIAECAHQRLAWDEFLGLADHHGVLPLAARNLLTHASSLPERVVQSLHTAYATNLRRNLWFANELARLADHFEEKKVKAVPYKGPILAQSVYGDLTLRNFGDLDFLIAPADFEPAKQALAELGYNPSTSYTPEIERFWLRTGYERSFDGPAGKYLVEVQWRVLPRFYAVDLSTEELLQRAVTTSLARGAAPTLSPEDLLLVLCLHAAKHLWMRMIWIADIAETMRSQPIDYNVVYSRAQTLGTTRTLAVSFWLAKEVLGATLSQTAESIVAADPQAQISGKEFVARLRRSATYDFESTEYFLLIRKLRERRQDRWRYIWRLMSTPSEGDLAAVRLPQPLFPLYRLVRLGRLLRKTLSRPR